MRAVTYQAFGEEIQVTEIADPVCPEDGVVIRVKAAGICRSDWHGWQGHDAEIKTLPHVPGHEFAGVIETVGSKVQEWQVGERVTIPFVPGCGHCCECQSGNEQVCNEQYQPGFSGHGAFAELVAVRYADVNLVRLPEEMNFVTAVSLGCRFSTAFRAVTIQGNVHAGNWVAVFGCGGVGLSAVMIAAAAGARVIAIDINHETLKLAEDLGASYSINASVVENISDAVQALTKRGAHVTIDALGSKETCVQAIKSLRKRGQHVQVGLLAGDDAQPPIPLDLVIANELKICGSHGLQAHRFPSMLEMISAGKLDLIKLLGKQISLDEAPDILSNMDKNSQVGVTIITKFN